MGNRSWACPSLLYGSPKVTRNIPAHVINTAVRRYHCAGSEVTYQSVVLDLGSSMGCCNKLVLLQHTGMYPVPERALCSTAEAVVFSLGFVMWSLFVQPLPVKNVKLKSIYEGQSLHQVSGCCCLPLLRWRGRMVLGSSARNSQPDVRNVTPSHTSRRCRQV
jgi:hypothetical protein